jgi:hypothetical protein
MSVRRRNPGVGVVGGVRRLSTWCFVIRSWRCLSCDAHAASLVVGRLALGETRDRVMC